MGIRTYKIELRMDFNDDKLHDILTAAAREAARTMVATAMMLKDGQREPRIMLEAGDLFMQDKELDIMVEGVEETRGE